MNEVVTGKGGELQKEVIESGCKTEYTMGTACHDREEGQGMHYCPKGETVIC